MDFVDLGYISLKLNYVLSNQTVELEPGILILMPESQFHAAKHKFSFLDEL